MLQLVGTGGTITPHTSGAGPEKARTSRSVSVSCSHFSGGIFLASTRRPEDLLSCCPCCCPSCCSARITTREKRDGTWAAPRRGWSPQQGCAERDKNPACDFEQKFSRALLCIQPKIHHPQMAPIKTIGRAIPSSCSPKTGPTWRTNKEGRAGRKN